MKVKEMKKIIIKESEEKYIEFIRDKFEKKREVSIADYRNNLDVLKKLDDDTLNTGIARIEAIESTFDSLKGLSFIFALIAAIVSYYGDLITNFLGENLFTSFVPLIITIIIFGFTCSLYVNARDKMITSVYFKCLLEDAKAKKN